MQYKFNFVPNAELEAPAGQAIFYRVWRQKWRGLIRIRRASQHARCTECVKYCLYRQKAKTEEERAKIQEAYNAHLSQIFADREVARRLACMSEMSCRVNSTIPPSKRVLYLQADGMDQAWFKVFKSRFKFSVDGINLLNDGIANFELHSFLLPRPSSNAPGWAPLCDRSWKNGYGGPHYTMWGSLPLALLKCTIWLTAWTRRTATTNAPF